MGRAATLGFVMKSVFVVCVLLTAGAVFFAWHQTRERQVEKAELVELRTRTVEVVERVTKLERENKTLKQENAQLESRAQAASPNEIAKLRAEAAELRRVRADLAQAEQSVQALRAANARAPQLARGALAPATLSTPGTSAAAPGGGSVSGTNEFRGFSFEGKTQMEFGHTVVMGGWQLPDGKRMFAFVTPKQDAAGNISFEPKLTTVSDSAVQVAGLTGILSDSRNAGKYLVRTPEATAALWTTLQNMGGGDVLSAPRVLVQPGVQAEIKMLNDAGFGSVFTFKPSVQPGAAGLDLLMGVKHDSGK